MINRQNQPKLGLAISGAAARSVFYIGFLEVLTENGIRIDYIAASSGASIVSACYALGKLELLKQEVFNLDRKFVMTLLERSKNGGGWYSLDKFEDYFREKFTQGKNLEEVTPKLCFLASDLESGESVNMVMGDIAHAVRISCTVPAGFEPVRWGNKVLVDGGLLTYMPGEVVRSAGMDVVVGVHVQATKHIFLKNQMMARSIYNQIKRFSGLGYLEQFIDRLHLVKERVGFLDFLDDLKILEAESTHEHKGIFSILGRSLDLALEASKKSSINGANYGCDLIVTAAIGNYLSSFDVSSTRKMYEAGRVEAKKNLKTIERLLESKIREK